MSRFGVGRQLPRTLFLLPLAFMLALGQGCSKHSSTKDITSFTILGVNGTITGTSIAITLPYGTDVTALAPTIAIAGSGASVSPASGVPQDFTHPVVYTVTAADGSTKAYTVTVSVAPSPAKDITAFTILGVNGAITGTSIALTLPFGTDVTALTPTIQITGASVSPASGVAHDFTNPVVYTVTAADGTTKNYTVTVNVALNPAKDITAFTILGVSGDITSNAISLTLPFGTPVTALTPTIQITGASVSPASGVATDFTTPVVYTVTAADSSTKDYTVTVNVALNPAKDITAFTILGVNGDITASAISLTLPFGTPVTALTPAIQITGASVSPASGVATDFTTPVVYTVTAADGSTKDYTVTVNVALNPAKDIVAFVIDGVSGTIAGTGIALTLPFGTDVTALIPAVTITGASVSPASGVATDFTIPVVYTVTAADGSTKDYTVTVTVAASPAKDIVAFVIDGVPGAIGVDTIALTLPFGTDVTALTPAVTITGASVSPASGAATDFTIPVVYTVTAADGSTKDYTVTVTVAASPAKDIVAFVID
ncbi:MAG TPA: hypothetical protein VLU43_04750, partial [Anaeromyxobacteraceae bacterium]|nr:hypothetical protein [Anaeromyxobacteraceae bacterium]